jgi:hypothetical protein
MSTFPGVRVPRSGNDSIDLGRFCTAGGRNGSRFSADADADAEDDADADAVAVAVAVAGEVDDQPVGSRRTASASATVKAPA